MARTMDMGLRREPQPPIPIVIPSRSSATTSSSVRRLSVVTGFLPASVARASSGAGVRFSSKTRPISRRKRAPRVDGVDGVQRRTCPTQHERALRREGRRHLPSGRQQPVAGHHGVDAAPAGEVRGADPAPGVREPAAPSSRGRAGRAGWRCRARPRRPRAARTWRRRPRRRRPRRRPARRPVARQKPCTAATTGTAHSSTAAYASAQARVTSTTARAPPSVISRTSTPAAKPRGTPERSTSAACVGVVAHRAHDACQLPERRRRAARSPGGRRAPPRRRPRQRARCGSPCRGPYPGVCRCRSRANPRRREPRPVGSPRGSAGGAEAGGGRGGGRARSTRA